MNWYETRIVEHADNNELARLVSINANGMHSQDYKLSRVIDLSPVKLLLVFEKAHLSKGER